MYDLPYLRQPTFWKVCPRVPEGQNQNTRSGEKRAAEEQSLSTSEIFSSSLRERLSFRYIYINRHIEAHVHNCLPYRHIHVLGYVY